MGLYSTFTYASVDSSRTVLEQRRSFIPSTLVSQLEEENPEASTGGQFLWMVDLRHFAGLIFCRCAPSHPLCTIHLCTIKLFHGFNFHGWSIICENREN